MSGLATILRNCWLKGHFYQPWVAQDSAETKATGRPENLQPASAILTQNWVS